VSLTSARRVKEFAATAGRGCAAIDTVQSHRSLVGVVPGESTRRTRRYQLLVLHPPGVRPTSPPDGFKSATFRSFCRPTSVAPPRVFDRPTTPALVWRLRRGGAALWSSAARRAPREFHRERGCTQDLVGAADTATTMDLNIYLLRQGTKLETAMPVGEDWRELERRGRFAAAGMRAFARQSPPKPPSWVAWIEKVFNFGDEQPTNTTTAVLVLFPVKNRVFAATFGSAWRAVRPEHIERDFGLIVALNQVRPEQLRHLITKTIELRTRERSTYNHHGSRLREFDVDVDVEWLRSAAGRSTRADCTVVAGSDALKLQNYTGNASGIVSLCEELLAIRRRGIPESFRFVQNVRPVRSDDPLHKELESQLLDLLHKGNLTNNVEIILDADLGMRVSSTALSCGRQHVKIEDADVAAVWRGLKELRESRPTLDLQHVHLVVTDGEGQDWRQPLLDAVQAEVMVRGGTYLRLERAWFFASIDYRKSVEQRLDGLPDLTDDLDLPIWQKNRHKEEGDYNKYVAKKKGWLLQDEIWLNYPDGGRVEPCDLLTPDARFVHVKDGYRASSIHHQLGQLSGAASLLSRDTDTRVELEGRFEAAWPGRHLKSSRASFVLAVGRRKTDKGLFGKMLLPKINTLEHARRVRALGLDFGVCRFEVAN
jgi:uncharacterized protein (TIGR04141 family)